MTVCEKLIQMSLEAYHRENYSQRVEEAHGKKPERLPGYTKKVDGKRPEKKCEEEARKLGMSVGTIGIRTSVPTYIPVGGLGGLFLDKLRTSTRFYFSEPDAAFVFPSNSPDRLVLVLLEARYSGDRGGGENNNIRGAINQAAHVVIQAFEWGDVKYDIYTVAALDGWIWGSSLVQHAKMANPPICILSLTILENLLKELTLNPEALSDGMGTGAHSEIQ